MVYKFYNEAGEVELSYCITPPDRILTARPNYIQLDKNPVFEHRDGYQLMEKVNPETREYYIEYVKSDAPEPSLEERNRADIDYLAVMTGIEL